MRVIGWLLCDKYTCACACGLGVLEMAHACTRVLLTFNCVLIMYCLHVPPLTFRCELRDFDHGLIGKFDRIPLLHFWSVLDLHVLFPSRRHDLYACVPCVYS